MQKRPILFEDLEVGTVVIQNPTDAVEAARDAAFNISKTKDVQFCPFSDGSYYYVGGLGGVGLVCRRQWLPDGWGSDQTGTHPNGDFAKQAWAYENSTGVNEMEGIGVLEGIHAANKAITRDLQALKAHDCTVTVRATTDSDAILHHISSQRKTKEKAEKTISQRLIKRIKEEMKMLQGHGVKVIAELHWCPRNKVAQLKLADGLAYEAMRTGEGFCNATQEVWSKDIKSDMAHDIETLVAEDLADRLAKAQEPPTELPNNTTGMSRKARKQEKRRAKKEEKRRARELTRTATSTDDSESHPQLPLPEILPPLKPVKSTPIVQTPLQCWHDWWFSPPWDGDKRD